MTTRIICRTALVLVGAAALLAAQQAQLPPGLNVPRRRAPSAPGPAAPKAAKPAGPSRTAASSSPVAPQPQVGSKEELAAIQATMNALDPDSRIKACEDLIANFPDTEFKAFALQTATLSAQEKNDYDQLMLYGERTLEADPNSYTVMLAMAAALAQRTREFDLDKEEKLKRTEDYAGKAMEVIETAPRPNPSITDQQWEEAKGDLRSQAHEALGMAAMVRKDYEKAVNEFKTAIDVGSTPNPVTEVRLGSALNLAARHDEAIAVLDKLMEDPQLDPQIRSFMQAERLKAVKAKEAKAQQ